jgi:hypothetical protein
MSDLIKFEGDALLSFCFVEFCKFTKRWRNPRDLNRLVISFDEQGAVLVGNDQLLTVLFSAAASPPAMVEKSESARLLLTCYRRAPDFVLALLIHLRGKIASLKLHQRKILSHPNRAPKEIWALINGKHLKLGAVEKARDRLRKSDAETSKLQRGARARLEAKWRSKRTRQKPL